MQEKHMSVSTIDPETLQAELKDNSQLLLIQVTTAEEFAQAHIPGAVLVLPAELVSGIAPATGRLPKLERLKILFSRIGYHTDADVVVYDDEGGGWAGRMGWTLDVIGHTNWRYLDGGLQAWQAAGLAFADTVEATPEPTHPIISIDTAPIAEIPDVLATIDDPDQVVWDVRSAEEFRGEKQASARVGHIPGAVNLDWLLLKDPARAQKIFPDIKERLAGIGIDASKRVITHCQTHHRSGLSYMIGRILGFDIRAYHGSWSEWGNREDTPIETGAGDGA
jgi:thiosulfate/3-mercaptopyruvate sulfurtransferase